jgi:hypothetical protein
MWVPVAAGWNMVGSIGNSLDLEKILPSRGVTRLSPCWGFDGSYVAAAALEPGRGYWVKMSGPGYLTYNATLPLGSSRPSAER